jgi:hypothetical protein
MTDYAPSRSRSLAAKLLLALTLAAPLAADVIVLRSGRKIEGNVVAESATKLTIETRFGNVSVARADIVKHERKLTPEQEFEARLSAVQSAQESFELCLWAAKAKLRPQAQRASERAIELERDHAATRSWRGEELHEGVWMTVAEAEAARMLTKGLVAHEGEWVTPEERTHRLAGRMLVNGEWMTVEEAQLARGFVFREPQGWIPKEHAHAQDASAQLARVLGLEFERVSTQHIQVAGPFESAQLRSVAERLQAIRSHFDHSFGAISGLKLLGGSVAQFYVLADDQAAYAQSAERLLALTDTVPKDWVQTVKQLYGFWYVHPYCLSVAKQSKRAFDELVGHCSHNWAHMLLNRLNYDQRMLPAWYDEGFANLIEYRQHGRNTNPCMAPATDRQTSAKSAFEIDGKEFRNGNWRAALERAVAAERLPNFSHLCQKGYATLSTLDVAYGMAIIEWIEAQGDGALGRFHTVVRATAPERGSVFGKGSERIARWERVFQESVRRGRRQAEADWIAWSKAPKPAGAQR